MTATLESGLEFRGCLPLAVRLLAALPDERELQQISHGNEQVLRSVLMLEEKPDLDDSDPLQQELRRQDQKLNLVLDLLGVLLVRFNAVPKPRELRLTDTTLVYADTAVEEGQDGQVPAAVSGCCEVQLYIEPTLPRPLRLFGIASSKDGSTTVQFQGLGRGLIDQLDKYIFRYHRRLVASRVAGNRSDSSSS
jgi:hypothetical protein